MRAGIVAASALATGLVYRRLNHAAGGNVETPLLEGLTRPAPTPAAGTGFPATDPETSFQDITHYNNFYEFSTGKEEVADAAAKFQTNGWQVSVEGLAQKPAVFALEDLLKISPPEERVYRMRCVEAWSMVIPWAGFPLSKLLDRVQPLSAAKFVAFETLLDRQRMPGQRSGVLDWPYVEGLRMDEAMHPLTLLASGLYGRALPPQDGAPSGWSCPGNTVSRASSPSSKSSSWRPNRPPPGTSRPRMSMASTPTSTPMLTIPAGARPPSSALANRDGVPPSCLTGTRSRWPIYTPEWTCAPISDRPQPP